jgi:hypothetical protein
LLKGPCGVQVQSRLSISERQLRREHSRAMQAVAALFWDQALTGHRDPSPVAVTKELPHVLAGRVIMRLILLSLLNYVLDVRSGGDIMG